MRFPLRLDRGARTRIGFPRHRSASARLAPILHLSPETNFDSTSRLRSFRIAGQTGISIQPAISASLASPIVWIGGREPLHHPRVARLACARGHPDRHCFSRNDGRCFAAAFMNFSPSRDFYFVESLRRLLERRQELKPSASETRSASMEASVRRGSAGFFICVASRR